MDDGLQRNAARTQRGIFKKLQDRLKGLDDRAAAVVGMAQVIATRECMDQHPCLKSVSLDDFRFFMAVASVFVLINQLRALNLAPEQALTARMIGELAKYNRHGPDAVADCKAFFDRTFDGVLAVAAAADRHLATSDTLGGWIVWNLIGHYPESEDERGAVRLLGLMICQGFSDWWTAGAG